MKNKRSFEDILKSKMDGLEQVPPDRLGAQLKHQIQAKKDANFQWQKMLIWAIGSLLLAWAYLQYIQSVASKTPPQPVEELQYANRLDSQDFHEESGHSHLAASQKEAKILVTQTPEGIKNIPYINARLQAKAEQKMIFLHAFNLDCNHCQKMKDSTLTNLEVQAFLQEHFVKIDIDLQLTENVEVIRFYGIKTSPTFLFLNGDGQLVTIAGGYHRPNKFMDILEKAMEENAAGSYVDLKTRKRVNPMPNQLKKGSQDKRLELLTANVFPNPTNGRFTVAVNGQKSPLQISIINLDGKIILEQTKNEFNKNRKYSFDLTGQQGQFIIQFLQGKSMIYKKIIVQ